MAQSVARGWARRIPDDTDFLTLIERHQDNVARLWCQTPWRQARWYAVIEWPWKRERQQHRYTPELARSVGRAIGREQIRGNLLLSISPLFYAASFISHP